MKTTREKTGMSPDICFKIGQQIRKIRVKREITQEYMAEKLNLSETHYCKIENGHRTCTLSNLISICKILDVTPNYLLEGCIDSGKYLEEKKVEELIYNLEPELQSIVREVTGFYYKTKRGEKSDKSSNL